MLDKSIADLAVSDVMAVLSTAKKYYRERDRRVREDVELYEQDYKILLPAGIDPIKSPSTKSIPDRAADRLGGARLQVHMDPRRGGQTESDHVERLEQAGAAIFYLARKRVKYNTIRALALHAFTRGAMVLKFQLDEKAAPKMPDRADFSSDLAFQAATKLARFRQLERWPLILDARPIESIYPDPETDGDNYVIEHYKRRVGDIKKNYPGWDGWATRWSEKDRTAKSLGRRFDDDVIVEFTEVTTREWRCAIVEGSFIPIGSFPAGPIPNAYGRPNYFIRYAGFGDAAGKPEQRCVSVLRGVRDVAMMESRMLTTVNKVAEDEAYGATVIDANDVSARETLSFGPGAVIESDKHAGGGGPSALRQQHDLPSVLQALQVAQRSVESGAVPNEAIGQPSQSRTGTPSGVAAAILTGQASMIIDPVKGALEDLISDAIPFMFYVLDTVWDGAIMLYGEVGPKTFVNFDLDSKVIDGHYGPVYVSLKLQAPEENHASWNLGIQAMQAGMPMHFVLEKFFAVENADEMIREMVTQKLVEAPETFQYLTARLIERLQAKAQNTADKLPGQNVPAPAGIPGPPGPSAPVAANGVPGPPMDPMMRAQLGIPGGPSLPGGPPVAVGMQ